jgi:hypothetical protein
MVGSQMICSICAKVNARMLRGYAFLSSRMQMLAEIRCGRGQKLFVLHAGGTLAWYHPGSLPVR